MYTLVSIANLKFHQKLTEFHRTCSCKIKLGDIKKNQLHQSAAVIRNALSRSAVFLHISYWNRNLSGLEELDISTVTFNMSSPFYENVHKSKTSDFNNAHPSFYVQKLVTFIKRKSFYRDSIPSIKWPIIQIVSTSGYGHYIGRNLLYCRDRRLICFYKLKL